MGRVAWYVQSAGHGNTVQFMVMLQSSLGFVKGKRGLARTNQDAPCLRSSRTGGQAKRDAVVQQRAEGAGPGMPCC